MIGTAAERAAIETAAIKLDSKASAVINDSNQTLTVSVTVANNADRMLIIQASTYNPSADIDNVTRDSQTGVEIGARLAAPSNGQTNLWYIANPNTGTATLTVDWDTNMGKRGIGVYSFYNVKQSNSGADAIANYVESTGGASQHSVINTANASTQDGVVAVTPTTAGSAIIDGCSWILGSGNVPVQTETLGWINVYPSGKTGASQYNLSPTISSSNNMYWTASSSVAHFAWQGFELKCETNNPIGLNFSNGTLFEESDTGKHYMFDGTDTWNEM